MRKSKFLNCVIVACLGIIVAGSTKYVGTLSYESARYKDYNLLMVLCLLSGAVVIACSLLAQAMNARLDPRLRPAEREVTSK